MDALKVLRHEQQWAVDTADAAGWLEALPTASLHAIITSPPYWSLRNYGVAGQLGQEPTPKEYVANLVAVFRLAARALRPDGTLWLNLGDCFDRKKQLLGMPWRVAFALQDDGWILRNDVIWAKKNPLPESVRDRFTASHEHLFLLARSGSYFFDSAAVREPAVEGGTRQRRDVWHLGSQPYPGAHVAVMPLTIAETAVLAGTAAGGSCSSCGISQRPVRERTNARSGREPRASEYSQRDARFARGGAFQGSNVETLGWVPACDCGAVTSPCVVADPFAGAGTTGVAAVLGGRAFVGADIHPDYAAMADERIGKSTRTP